MFNNVILYFLGNGWYLAAVNENCIDACESLRLECSEEEFYQHNAEVDSSVEVLNIIKELGGTISTTSCSGEYGTASDVPVYSSSQNYCLFSNSSRSASTFNCTSLPNPENHNKQRICWCHSAGYL